jgi:hypothetical protein
MKLAVSLTVHRSYLGYIFTFSLVKLVVAVPIQHDREEQRRRGGWAFDSCQRHEIKAPYTFSAKQRFYCVTSYLTEKLSKLRGFDRQ